MIGGIDLVCAARFFRIVFCAPVMGAAGELGPFPGVKPDKKNGNQACRAPFATTAAANGVAQEEKITPVARSQVRRPDVSRTALATIGEHRILNLK